ncbi:hypothetical protein LOTGIDRAFT_226052 [Lottia gigantea]|uniref:Peroxisomal carnitine O-octanoyltransferase n=1 Tax=Lottia gigantea TaxID=225164 RepID=V4CE05_LOTGI|nr:hypothetical protein LOTGIDRAFT_226052 [Lottia gigantea]ESP00180.1 hypothetical protein LOTGIDRAFT_226052 [Lottia gigantea]
MMMASSKSFLSDTEKTFEYQNILPSLPIPPLQHTLDRYLDSVKPHVTEEEYRQTEFLVNQFASGLGKELHFKLSEKAKYMRNWLEKWWDEAVYLELRNPNALYGNMSGPGPYMYNLWTAKADSQLERASLMLNVITEYWQNLRRERLRPHKDNKGRSLCMNQFRRMFNCSRIPGHFKDELLYHFKTESEGDCPSNIIVLYKGRIFSIQSVDENDEPLTAPEFMILLQIIYKQCNSSPPGQGLANLTTLKRSDWAEARGRILALHPDNYHKLQEIEKSVFVLGLDDYSPKDESEVSWQGLGGNAEGKWFDKSLCVVVYKNGLIASNCDHAPTDAMVLVSCTYYVHLRVLEHKGSWQGTKTIRKLKAPMELELHLDPHIIKTISEAKTIFPKNCDSVEVLTSHFTEYGKSFIRKHKLHPDTHVQLALQLAYYRQHRRPAPTYETATTRRFYHGRTETMRSCTTEAINWCKAMVDPSVGGGRRYQLYKMAADRHNKLMDECSNFEGCDRHLLGLAMICREENIPLPQIFTDSSFFRSGGGGNFILSTSSVGYTPVYGGVAPMCSNGYGAFYRIENHQIVFFLTSWTEDKDTSVQQFAKDLHTTLQEMIKLIQTQVTESARL